MKVLLLFIYLFIYVLVNPSVCSFHLMVQSSYPHRRIFVDHVMLGDGTGILWSPLAIVWPLLASLASVAKEPRGRRIHVDAGNEPRISFGWPHSWEAETKWRMEGHTLTWLSVMVKGYTLDICLPGDFCTGYARSFFPEFSWPLESEYLYSAWSVRMPGCSRITVKVYMYTIYMVSQIKQSPLIFRTSQRLHMGRGILWLL